MCYKENNQTNNPGKTNPCQLELAGCGCITRGNETDKQKQIENLECYVKKLEEKVRNTKKHMRQLKNQMENK